VEQIEQKGGKYDEIEREVLYTQIKEEKEGKNTLRALHA
jgi:hypothetical protein